MKDYGKQRRKRNDDPIKYIGADEKSFLKGQSYITVMTDIESKRVLDIAKDRKAESIDKLFNTLEYRKWHRSC